MLTSAAKRSIGFLGVAAAAVMFTAAPAMAQWHNNQWQGDQWHGNHRPPPPPPPGNWHGGYGHPHYSNNSGAIIGGALLGLGVGAAIGALAAPPAVVYAPPPAYYQPPPPPVYYGY